MCLYKYLHMSGIRINEIPSDSTLDGQVDLVHVYKLVGGQYKSVAAPLSAVAFQGAKGNPGSDGTNAIDGNNGDTLAQLVCYRYFDTDPTSPSYSSAAAIAATKPGLAPNDDGSFNFDNRVFVAPQNWSAGVPTTLPGREAWTLYHSNGVAKITGATGTDDGIVWSDPVASGIQGQPGTSGKSTYQAVVFTRAATQPVAPKGGRFNFLDDELTPPGIGTNVKNSNPDGTNANQWYVDTGGAAGPSGDDQLYMCNHQFAAPGDEGTDDAGDWSTPTRFASDGADGFSTYFGTIYKRTNSNIGTSVYKPGGGVETAGGAYNFSTNAFEFPVGSASFNGWSEEVPPDEKTLGSTTSLWASHTLATAKSNFLGNTDVKDETLLWSVPVRIQQPLVDGNQGSAVTQLRAYKRTVGTTPLASQLSAVEFDFENKTLDMKSSGWSSQPFASTLPANDADYGYDFLYVSVGIASSVYNTSTTSYDTVTANWADPILAPEDGQAAISTFLGSVYTRYAGGVDIQTTAHRPISGKFDFSSSQFTVIPEDDSGTGLVWSTTIPTNTTGQLYISQRNFATLGAAGIDGWNASNPWSTPAVLAFDGTAGVSAATNARLSLYYGSDTELVGGNIPNFPDNVNLDVDLDATNTTFGKPLRSETRGVTASITSNQILSSNPAGGTVGTGWYTTLPSNDWIYISEVTATDSDATDSVLVDVVSGSEFSGTVAYRKPGGNGLAGLGAAVVSLYRRTGTTSVPNPPKPDGPIKYYLGTSADGTQPRGSIELVGSTSLQNWTLNEPSFTNNNDHYLWKINATASGRLCADQIFANEWSTPSIFSQNPFDLTTTTVSHIVQSYKRSSTAPTDNPGSCTVNLSGEQAGAITTALSNGWSNTILDGSEQIWIVHATASGPVVNNNSTDTVQASEWTTPSKWGIKGETGIQGADGTVSKIISLFKRTGRNPSPAVTEPLSAGVYDFSDDTFTFETGYAGTWSYALPAKDVNDRILWQTFATALCSTSTDSYTIAKDKWKEPKAITEDGTTITPIFSSDFGSTSASFDQQFDLNGVLTDHTHINFSDEYTSIDSSEVLTKAFGGTVNANTLTYIKIKGEQGLTGGQGVQGVQGDGVVIAYAEDENGTGVALTPSSTRLFVKYIEFTGSKPTLSQIDAAHNSGFVKYKGEDANKIVPVYATSNTGANANLNPQAGSTHVSFIEDTVGTLASDFDNTWPSLSANRTFVKIKGNDGSSINILGTRATVGDLPTTSSTGDAYIIGGNLHVSDGSSFTNVGQVQGPQGNTGLTGPGAQIHFKYANDTTGNGIPDDFTNQSGEDLGEFLGVATTNSTDNPNNTDPANIGDYTFTRVKGDPLYTHIAYAGNAIGAQFTTDDAVHQGDPGTRQYIGISVNNDTPTESTDHTKYTWSKIVGEDGQQGIRGPVGSVPIFATDANGTSSSLTQSDSRRFVFFYTGGDVASDASTSALKALGSNGDWKKITGDSLYTHIKYADRALTASDTGADMTDDPTGKKYIGLSLNNASSTESNEPEDYIWSLIQGAAGLPDGCQAVYAYGNSVGQSSITYLEDENALQLDASSDINIGMVYPAIDVTSGNKIQFEITYKTPDAADTDGVYIRLYEATTDLAEGKDRIGNLTGSAATGNSPLIQAHNVSHTYNDGNASSSNGAARIAVNPANSDLEDGPVANNYTTKTITFTPASNSKYVSLTILNWSGMGTKRLWVKPVRTTIVGEKGATGADGITSREVQIFYKDSLTAAIPTITYGAGNHNGSPVSFDRSNASVSNLPDGWSTAAPNAESGKKIYRATTIVTHDASLTTGTQNIVEADWGSVNPWSVGANRTAPVVSTLATYSYLEADYLSIQNNNAPQSDYYSFRKKGVQFTDVNNGWGSGITTSTDPITDIGQILFTVKGKDNVDNTDFWSGLDTAAEFIWKYGSSWILFQRTGQVDVGGSTNIYTGVTVNVLDHSDDIAQIKDLPGFYTGSGDAHYDSSKAAEVVFGYIPTIIRSTVELYLRSDFSAGIIAPQNQTIFNYDSNSLTGNLNSLSQHTWSQGAPAKNGKSYLWKTFASSEARLNVGDGSYKDEIEASEWSTPVIVSQDGIDGAKGNSYFIKFLYTRADRSDPAFKTDWTNTAYKPGLLQVTTDPVNTDLVIGNVKITDRANLTSTSNPGIVWSETIPDESEGNFLFVITAPVETSIGTTNYVSIPQLSWASPSLLSKDGVGINSRTVRLYKRTAGAAPTGTTGNELGFSASSGTPEFSYNFSTGNLNTGTVNINGWYTGIPEGGGGTVWVSRVTASGAGTTDSIPWSEWPAPERLVSDGNGLTFIKAFANRTQYEQWITNQYSGMPPINSYHIEEQTETRNDGSTYTRKVSYLYIGGQNTDDKYLDASFQQLTIDGVEGQQGGTFSFQGTTSTLASAPTTTEGHVYKVTSGTNVGRIYVRSAGAWELLTTDGEDGDTGLAGPSGDSVYICYSTKPITENNGSGPTKPGNSSNGNVAGVWSTDANPPTGTKYNWMSQKVAQTPVSGSWGTPIQIVGVDGAPGFRTFELAIYKRAGSQPNPTSGSNSSNRGAYDFINNKLLPPLGWSTSIKNAGANHDNSVSSTGDPTTGVGYEWYVPSGGSFTDSNDWRARERDYQSFLAQPLWRCRAVVSISVGDTTGIDDGIFWETAEAQEINGVDLIDDSVDSDKVANIVKSISIQKIVATYEKPGDARELLTQDAYDALAGTESTHPNRYTDYGWRNTLSQGAIDTLSDDTLYLIF